MKNLHLDFIIEPQLTYLAINLGIQPGNAILIGKSNIGPTELLRLRVSLCRARFFQTSVSWIHMLELSPKGRAQSLAGLAFWLTVLIDFGRPRAKTYHVKKGFPHPKQMHLA